MRLRAVLAAIVGTLMASPSMAQSDDHFLLGTFFCQLRANGAERPVRFLLTKALLEAIDAAQAASEKFEAANPGDKPPLGDGIPFQSFPDVADSCGPANFTEIGGVVQMDIQYKFKATPEANFSDRIVVKDENGRPLIDDVLYGSDNYKSGLRQVLADIAAGKF